MIARIAAVLSFVVSLAIVPTRANDQAGKFDSELVAVGEEIFERTAGGTGCAACHGHYALGDYAPNLRGSDEARIHGGLEMFPAMQFLVGQISEDDITALAEYLQYLDTLVPGKFTRLRGGHFDVTEIRFPTNAEVQFVVENRDRRTCTFEAAIDGFETVELGRMDHISFRWTTPAEPATFEAGCQESPDSRLMIIVE